MPLVKVSDKTLDQPKLVVANDFKSFIEKAEKKLGYKVDKIVRQGDASEIDDEDVFEELIKQGGELWFVCLRESDEYPIKDKTKIKTATATKSDSKLKETSEKPSGTTPKSDLVKAEESKPEEKSSEEPNTEEVNSKIGEADKEEEKPNPEEEKPPAESKTEDADKPEEEIPPEEPKKEEENLKLDEGDKVEDKVKPEESKPPEDAKKDSKNSEKEEDDLIKTIHKIMGGELDINSMNSMISDKEVESVELFTKEELNEIENGTIDESLNSLTVEEFLNPDNPGSKFKDLATKMIVRSRVVSVLSAGNIPNREIKTIVIDSSPDELNKEAFEKLKTTLFKEAANKIMTVNKIVNSMRLDLADRAPEDAQKSRISSMLAEIMNAEKVDICFLVDCTGSMKPYIDEVKQTLNKIADKLKLKFKSFELRCSFVGYRDHADLKHRIVLLPFSNDIEQFKSFVTDIRAGGGGDLCEDTFGGLEQVCNLDWSNPSRILLHISDAPCHGKQFHDESVNDDYPDGDPRGLQLSDLLRCLIKKRISYYFAEINKSTAKMVQEFNKELARQNSKKIKLFKLPSVGDLTELIAKTIMKTIKDTKTLVPTKKQETKNIELSIEPIDWSLDKFKKVNAVLYQAPYSGDLNELKTKPIDFKESNIELNIADKPFDKGSLRYAYAAQANIGTDEAPNYKKLVVKQSLFKGDEFNTLKYFKDLTENQVVSTFLAKKFFELTKPQKSLRFIDVSIIYVPERNEYYSVEEFIEGEFVKWISNDGVINEDIYSCTLDAFSHWSYEATRNYLIVTDLQGALVDNKEYILTDPAITSPDDPDRFANTNLGAEGLKDFFSSHQCNHICRKLGLKKHEFQTLPDREETDLMTKLN